MDVNVIRNTVKMIQAFVKTEEMQKMKRRKGFDHFKSHLITIFPSFYEDFETLFNMIVEEKDITFLEKMLYGLEEIEKGKSREDVEKQLGEQLAEKYVYTKLGKPK
jgi:hypothetical protein